MLRRASRRTPAEVTAPAGLVVGNLAAPVDALVDPGGAVHLVGSGLVIEWWVGAADRWHVPAEEPGTAVTQRRIDGLPVAETSLRVPGGQVLARVWCVAGPGAGALVVELENRSRDAVALAAVIRGGSRAVGFDGDRSVTVGGHRSMALARRPARATSGAGLRDAVTAGQAPLVAALDAASEPLALVWPLAHTARLRLAVALGDGAEAPVEPEHLPDAEQVVRGWQAHLDAGTRLVVPDARLAEHIVAARGVLLVQAARHRPTHEAVALVLALDAFGHHDAALAPFELLLDGQRYDGSMGERKDPSDTAAAIAAWAGHVRATADQVLAERLAEPVAKAAHRLGKLQWKSAPPAWVARAQLDAAELLELADQADAADLCRRRASRDASTADPDADPAAGSPAETLAELLDFEANASGAGAAVAARFLLAAREFLVDDRKPGRLRLLPVWPDEWLGVDLEVHGLRTRGGLLSFAVRWHGARPALLWERHGPGPVTVEVPGLDAGWSASDPIGEALLGPIEPAGGLPKVVAPLATPGTPAADASGSSESFR